jgi:hypothetical protein
MANLHWKTDWTEAQHQLTKWWAGEGLALSFYDAVRSTPRMDISPPKAPASLEFRWTDPVYRCDKAEFEMVHRHYPAESIPYFDTEIGPGSLGVFLGATPNFAEDTVWYTPNIDDCDLSGELKFQPQNNHWWNVHLALIDEGLKRAQGRYLVGVPDLIENLDTLAALRGEDKLLLDLYDRPDWVKASLDEITASWIHAFDLIFEKVKDEARGNVFSAFRIWGPGKTAKLQCDFSVMISPKMFRQFVVPQLETQCQHLDYPMYHLDGTNALQHLDALLEIEDLKAIEWTPQAGKPQGGSPEWYDLYRRIKSTGKSIQAVSVQPKEVIPLLDVIGPDGTFIVIFDPVSETELEVLLTEIEPYY